MHHSSCFTVLLEADFYLIVTVPLNFKTILLFSRMLESPRYIEKMHCSSIKKSIKDVKKTYLLFIKYKMKNLKKDHYQFISIQMFASNC